MKKGEERKKSAYIYIYIYIRIFGNGDRNFGREGN